MKKRLLILALILILASSFLVACGQETPGENLDHNSSGPREITDMAGRVVVIPEEVKTGLGTGAIGTYMLYTMDPQTLVGVNYEFNDAEKAYILPEYHDLIGFGQGQQLNLEAVLGAAPDVLISYGTISDSTIADAEAIQSQTGIPCIMLDGYLATDAQSYRLLGEIFGQQRRCEKLAQYAEKVMAFAAAINIPAEDRVRVFYGNGIESLETAPQGSSHAELLDIVQAENVAVLSTEITTRISISPEQIIEWNPQVILLNGEPTENVSPAEAVTSFVNDRRYQNVQAVKNAMVYPIPKYPYSWFDRPPGPNRLLGIYWLSEVLYPDQYDLDVKAEAKSFYQLFYHIELTDDQVQALIGF